MRIEKIILVCLCIFTSTVSFGQAPQGINIVPAGGSAPDQIDLNALSNILSIPIRNKAGRGMPFEASLQYNSQIYSNDSSAWYPDPQWGWNLITSVGTGTSLTATSSEFSCGTIWSHLVYTDSNGTQHGFNTGTNQMGVTIWDESSCPTNPGIYYSGFPATASDGSGYVINPLYNATQPYEYSSFSITSPAGVVTVLGLMPLQDSSDPITTIISQTDSNGNQIKESFPLCQNGYCYISYTPTYRPTSYTPTFTDTTGQTVLTQGSNSSTSPLANTIYSYSNAAGTVFTYTLVYKSYNILTSFGCSGISEYSTSGTLSGYGTMLLLDHITLPDGHQYQFTYQPTSTGSSTVTGLISQITLPSGGSISYSNNSPCPNGTQNGTQTQTRILNDGKGNLSTWTYSTQSTSTNNLSGPPTDLNTTTITDPTGAKQVISFIPGSMVNYDPYLVRNFQASSQTYSPSGALLQTLTTTYTQANFTPPSPYLTGPMSGVSVVNSYPGPSGVSSEVSLTYNSIGLVTNSNVYDFGPVGGSPGPLLMSTATTYPNSGADVAFPSSVTTYDGAGIVTGQTLYYYDQTAPVATSGTPNHQAGTNSGNLTTVQTLVSGSNNYLTKTFSYNDTGTLNSSTDVNGAVTNYTYNQCGNSFLGSTSTTVQHGSGATLTTSSQWDCYGGVATSSTDVNGNTTTVSSTDPWWRPMTTVDALGTTTTATYPTTSSNTSSVSKTFEDQSPSQSVLTTYDGLGRVILTQSQQGPTSSTYSSVASTYTYPSSGYTVWSSTPYSGPAGSYITSGTGTTNVQDVLGRPILSEDAGGGMTSYSYSLNDVAIMLGPAPSALDGIKSRQLEYNGAGQLASVCEITSVQGSGVCGQNTANNGYETLYTYDGSNLTKISQNVQAGAASTQTRTLSYDLLGREVGENIPETGSSMLAYDVDPSGVCPGSYPGDVIKKVDNAGNTLCVTYDSLHRPLSAKVVSGPYASVTPQRNYVYDAASYSGTAMQNVKGNLAEAYTCTGSCSAKLTDLYLSMTPVISAPQITVIKVGNRTIVTTIPGHPTGQTISNIWESTPNSNGYFNTLSLTNANGTPASISAVEGGNAMGFPSVKYGMDSLGRPYSVTDTTNNLALVSSTSYLNTTGAVQGVTFGNGDSDGFQYDPATSRQTSFGSSIIGSSPFSVSGTLTWNTNGSLAQFTSTDTSNPANNQNCQYQADDLSRLSVANCSGTWGQSFSYDAFGNLAKGGLAGNSGMTQTYAATYLSAGGNASQTNQVTGGTPAAYDLNGNALTSGLNSFTWNAYNEPVTIQGGIGATYDALGRVVEVSSGGTYKQYFYDPAGDRLGIVQAGTLVQGTVPLPGGATAVYGSTGFSYFRHKDWLGSSRLATTWLHTVYAKEQYAPFGETYQEVGQDRSFTGQDQDTTSGVYDFLFRRLDATAGRWVSPDPAGWSVVDLTNPQSLNRYAYVMNTPNTEIDPNGLDECTGNWNMGKGSGSCDEGPPPGTCTIDCDGDGNQVPRPSVPGDPILYTGTFMCGSVCHFDPYMDMSGAIPYYGPFMYVWSDEVNHMSTYTGPNMAMPIPQTPNHSLDTPDSKNRCSVFSSNCKPRPNCLAVGVKNIGKALENTLDPRISPSTLVGAGVAGYLSKGAAISERASYGGFVAGLVLNLILVNIDEVANPTPCHI